MEPEQHIVSLGNGGWKTAGSFLGHEPPRLRLDTLPQEATAQGPEKRKQGQSEKVTLECPGHNGSRY